MNTYSIYDTRDYSYLGIVEAPNEDSAVVEYRSRNNAATMPITASLEGIDIDHEGERRQWAYNNLMPMYSESEIANMDTFTLAAVIDSLACECPDCGELHDGTTTGTERCSSCEEGAER